MTKEEFARNYHAMRLEVELCRHVGKAFQDFFERIMQKTEPSFMMIKPMGRVGDWKADGYSMHTATIYQCYAPEELTGPETAKKIKEDFNGARAKWKDKMKRWVFVWNFYRGLPPQAVAELAELKKAYPTLVGDHIGPAGLWDIVQKLSLADREALLGVVPDLNDVPTTTAAEIQVLMTHLGSHSTVFSGPVDLDLTAIVEKLQRNRLSAAVSAIIKPAIPVARLVGKFVTSMPEPAFSEAIAMDLARRYNELAASADEPDVIFGNLIEYVLGDHRPEPRLFWAAAGIVTHYFELCDLFER